jgi:hypothetical protein
MIDYTVAPPLIIKDIGHYWYQSASYDQDDGNSTQWTTSKINKTFTLPNKDLFNIKRFKRLKHAEMARKIEKRN